MYAVKSLTEAASVTMKDYFKKENDFELWKFCKNINPTAGAVASQMHPEP